MSEAQFITFAIWVGRLFSSALVILFIGATVDMVNDFIEQIRSRSVRDVLMCGGVLLAQVTGLFLSSGVSFLLWTVPHD